MSPPATPSSAAPLVEFFTSVLVPYFEPLDPNDVLTWLCGILLLGLAARTLRRSEQAASHKDRRTETPAGGILSTSKEGEGAPQGVIPDRRSAS
jgi:hypothetical protein